MSDTKEIVRVNPREEMVEFDLDFHIHKLLSIEPFFARISRYVTKVATYSIPTCGIILNDDDLCFDLAYNPKFLKSLTDDQIIAVLMHEFYHIALSHCTTRKKAKIPFQIQNIAMDMAINSLPNMYDSNGNSRLPDMAVVPGLREFKNYKPGLTFEQYLEMLMQNVEEIQVPGPGGNGESMDDHSSWMEEDDKDDSKANAKQVAAHRIKDIVQKAAEECDKSQRDGSSRAWGSVSHEIKRMINDALAHKLDPEVIFRYFCKTSVRSIKKHRITKINKRWAYIHPGRAWERRAKIMIAVDQSGSVSDQMLEKIFSWMGALSKFCEFIVVPFDDAVFEDKVYTWQKNEKKKRERVLCGGTNFNAPTDYANKNNIDALIIFTDLCAPKPKKCKVPRLWLTDKNSAAHPYFTTSERILVID